MTDERAAYVALALVPGIGTVRMASLLSACDTALGALSAPFEFLRAIPGISPAAATAISTTSPEAGGRVLDQLREIGAHCLIPTDPDFPAALREIPEAPTLLFLDGDVSLLRRPAVAIVGSRDHTDYGATVAATIGAGAAAAGLVVVSGMARGLDAVAHAAALDAGGTTIGVLGNGLGVIYPSANRRLYQRVESAGLLLTEFPPGERPGVGAFPRRNRLISGLARVTVVIEAAEGSGTLITVGTALAQGRDVMAVPGNITSDTSAGTNRLIRDGAEPLLELADLLSHYPEVAGGVAVPTPVNPQPVLPPDLPPAQYQLALALGAGPAAVDEVVLRSGLGVAEALAALSALELKGVAGQDRGVAYLTAVGDPGR